MAVAFEGWMANDDEGQLLSRGQEEDQAWARLNLAPGVPRESEEGIEFFFIFPELCPGPLGRRARRQSRWAPVSSSKRDYVQPETPSSFHRWPPWPPNGEKRRKLD